MHKFYYSNISKTAKFKKNSKVSSGNNIGSLKFTKQGLSKINVLVYNKVIELIFQK